MGTKDKIILALDVEDTEKALELVSELKEYIEMFKIGKQLFTKEGPDIIKKINSLGGKVFLDLKYYDIPNTVAKAGKAATELKVGIFNVHCSGGYEMMKTCADAVKSKAEELGIKKPLILGVTLLTSIDTKILKEELGIKENIEEYIIRLAKLAKKAGLDGVIASPKEIRIIKENCGKDFLVITPGVRPLWSQKNDQKRVATPKQAIEMGADFIVIGRAISQQNNRIEATKKIIEEIS